MKKWIFVTGGVVSSLGKGLTCAAIGTLLEGKGYRIAIQKYDPYINVDPGTMNPYEHGEVYVTPDGTETDLDLGHYERFTHTPITKASNFTSGKIYYSVIMEERHGKEYLGKTVQMVPHITNEIKKAFRSFARKKNIDVIICELGGTIGDIEGLPFTEAMRQFQLDVGRENVMFIHLTLLPYLPTSGEVKTKPTQHSVGKLREIGIQPDVIICRTQKDANEDVRKKISLFCNVPLDAVIIEKDVDHTIYEVPLMLHEQGLDRLIAHKLGIRNTRAKISGWRKMVDKIINPKHEVDIAVVGKYIELPDTYKSVYESITHAGIANNCRVHDHRVQAEHIERKGAAHFLEGMSGILVPGGFGDRGMEGKIEAVRYARENGIPYLGLCVGMQLAVIEFARNVLGYKKANSTEFDPKSPHLVIDIMESQKKQKHLGGTMRLGHYPCRLLKGSRAHAAYGKREVKERHRHRYEFNNKYMKAFKKAGMRFSGMFTKGDLVEIIELPEHPWFVAVQFHPEFQSKPMEAHPLFRDFITAAMDYASKRSADAQNAGNAAPLSQGSGATGQGEQ
ncbi:MAG: CTP synthase [Planctomycetota bacterium]|nr:MAG: CTP synthase [Planctomycetota bacterium]